MRDWRDNRKHIQTWKPYTHLQYSHIQLCYVLKLMRYKLHGRYNERMLFFTEQQLCAEKRLYSWVDTLLSQLSGSCTVQRDCTLHHIILFIMCLIMFRSLFYIHCQIRRKETMHIHRYLLNDPSSNFITCHYSFIRIKGQVGNLHKLFTLWICVNEQSQYKTLKVHVVTPGHQSNH